MESRLLAYIRGGLGAPFVNGSYNRSFMRRVVAVFHTQIPAGPAIHSAVPDEAEVEAAEKAKAAEAQREYKPTKTDPFVRPKPPVSPSPKLENILNPPTNHTTQQKRKFTINPPPLADVACVGLDGTPLPEEEETKREAETEERARRGRQRILQVPQGVPFGGDRGGRY